MTTHGRFSGLRRLLLLGLVASLAVTMVLHRQLFSDDDAARRKGKGEGTAAAAKAATSRACHDVDEETWRPVTVTEIGQGEIVDLMDGTMFSSVRAFSSVQMYVVAAMQRHGSAALFVQPTRVRFWTDYVDATTMTAIIEITSSASRRSVYRVVDDRRVDVRVFEQDMQAVVVVCLLQNSRCPVEEADIVVLLSPAIAVVDVETLKDNARQMVVPGEYFYLPVAMRDDVARSAQNSNRTGSPGCFNSEYSCAYGRHWASWDTTTVALSVRDYLAAGSSSTTTTTTTKDLLRRGLRPVRVRDRSLTITVDDNDSIGSSTSNGGSDYLQRPDCKLPPLPPTTAMTAAARGKKKSWGQAEVKVKSSLSHVEAHGPCLAVDTDDKSYFFSNRAIVAGDYMSFGFAQPATLGGIRVFTGSWHEPQNRLLVGTLEIVVAAGSRETIHNFSMYNNGVARVTFPSPLPISAVDIRVGKDQTTWLSISSILFLNEDLIPLTISC